MMKLEKPAKSIEVRAGNGYWVIREVDTSEKFASRRLIGAFADDELVRELVAKLKTGNLRKD